MKLSCLMLLLYCHICVFPLDKSTDVMSAWCFIVHCDPVAESFICQQMFLYTVCCILIRDWGSHNQGCNVYESISHKSYLLHNHSNSVKISECWFIRGQFTFISTQAWPSVPAEPDAHYSWFLPFMSPVSSGGPATWLMLPASPLKICLFLLGFRLFRLFYFQFFRHFWLISFLFLYASKGLVTQIPYVPKKLRQKDRCWWVGSAWSETWGRGIPGRHQMQNCNQTGLCD